MKVLVIGCGSIGRRHAANAAILATVGVFDAAPDATKACAAAVGARSFVRIEDALDWLPRAVVIATPHRSHLELARRAIAAGADVLIEKPLSQSLEGVEDFLQAAEAKDRRAYVVCNMRFHPGPSTLRQALHRVGQPLFARAHFGNYLPSMRAGRDYRELYAARRSEGGGVILDAVHEIDYLSWLFGAVENVTCRASKLSELDLDVEDHALLSLRHVNGVEASIELDYLRHRKSRGCEIVGTQGVLVWESDGRDPERCAVRFFPSGGSAWEAIADIPEVDTGAPYRDLMRAFLQEIERPGTTVVLSARSAAAVLTVAVSALASARADGVASHLQHEAPAT